MANRSDQCCQSGRGRGAQSMLTLHSQEAYGERQFRFSYKYSRLNKVVGTSPLGDPPALPGRQ